MSSSERDSGDEEASQNDLLGVIRDKCLSKGFSSMRCFSVAFRFFDQDFSKKINFTEFEAGLSRFGIKLTQLQTKNLFKLFDRDGSGYIDFEEFYHKLSPPLSGTRLTITTEVFKRLDKNGDGCLRSDEIFEIFADKVKQHPKFITGEWNEKEVIDKLMDAFEQTGSRDGVVTLQEFLDFYSAVSSCVQEDAYFESHLKACWGLA